MATPNHLYQWCCPEVVVAFDLLKDEIDTTPFLPVFVVGKQHILYIKVARIEGDGNGRGELPESNKSHCIIT